MPRRALFALALPFLAGCAAEPEETAAPAPQPRLTLPSPGAEALPLPDGLPNPADDPTLRTAERAARIAAETPHIYFSVQAERGRPVSVVFAIDAARDNTPADDPAIRLTPAEGDCNPQELRRYAFPAADAARPAFSEAEALRGVTAAELPRFLAAAVTERMLEADLAAEPEDTRPQNVCTRKLWERLTTPPATADAGQ